uniref:Retinol binding protein 7 n=1 Tax=Leptobrachium leishanense TaxID=445787 RepID=A0A8C5N0B9_9ANUR
MLCLFREHKPAVKSCRNALSFGGFIRQVYSADAASFISFGFACDWDTDVFSPFTPGIDFVLRKMAKLMKPQKVIQQNGDVFTIRTISSLRNYAIEFTVGKEFDEETKGVDNQKLKSLVTWDNGRLVCVQIGEKKNRGWVHWLEGDDLHLTNCYKTHKAEMRKTPKRSQRK